MTGPLKKFRAGQISCALWENEASVNGRQIVMLKATVERRYKDRDGRWKSSGSFGRNDIPLVIWCMQKAFDSMLEERTLNEEVSEADAASFG